MHIIKTILAHVAVAVSGAALLITPQIFRLAAQSRIYPGYGGEILWAPVWLVSLCLVIKTCTNASNGKEGEE